MPRSKHRRKGKTRPRVARPESALAWPAEAGPGDLFIGDLRDDDEREADEADLFDEAMQQVMDELEEQFGDEEPDYGFAYDPSVDPDPQAWLALDEMVRMFVVEQAHRDVDFGDEASPRAHALAHVMVETGLAQADGPTRAALERLRREGLDRHEAVHAIGGVLMWHVHEVLAKPIDDKAASDRIYHAALEKLTAETWRRDFGPARDDEE
jgi:hypothetical protein